MMASVLQIEDEKTISQMLIDAALGGDEPLVDEILCSAVVDVNYTGTVQLTMKHIDCVQHEEAPDELKLECIEFKTDVTPLFAAAHSGHIEIAKKLLAAGADVNQRLFRGYSTTAATREGHYDILIVLLKAGSSQLACEEALLEACLFGQVKSAELLMSWEMTRPEISVCGLIHASCRGFVGIVELLIKSGLDVNSCHRVLLRSVKPVLHTSVDCTALIAAVVCRQAAVVNYLLKAGANAYYEARVGAWSWDVSSGEVLRVGAGMADPYNAAWCAIEYWEAEGAILGMLLEHVSANNQLQGRSLLCHAVLCGNVRAVEVLLNSGANMEFCVSTEDGSRFYPIHLAVRLGAASVLNKLIAYGCNLNARTESGETALMLCVSLGQTECFHELLVAGGDFGLVSGTGATMIDILNASTHRLAMLGVIWDAILSGKKLHSSNLLLFSPLHFIAQYGNSKVMQKILEQDLNLNLQDEYGFSAAMVAAHHGNMDSFKVLVFAGALVSLKNSQGESALELAERSGHKERCERILFDAILLGVLQESEFKALHFAARRGNSEVLAHLLKLGSPVNALNDDGYTPLMLSVMEGHIEACKLLLFLGADCYLVNARGETALSLARRCPSGRVVEGLLLDHMAKKLVLRGDDLLKHTREGKGRPHLKHVKVLKSGVLSWGESKRRNVFCTEANLGSSFKFQKNRKGCGYENPCIFRVVTHEREIHFDADSSFTAELWVRGINVITKEALGKNNTY